MSASLEHGIWGTWPTVRLTTSALQLEVASEVGARVIALRDLRRDREWLLAGTGAQRSGGTGLVGRNGRLLRTAVVRLGRMPAQRGGLRRPTRCAGSAPARPRRSVGSRRLPARRRRARRRGTSLECAALAVSPVAPALLPADDTVLAEYALTSRADEALPFLWSQHPVFALEPGCRLELPGVERASLTWQLGIDLPDEPAWPLATTKAGDGVDLATVTSRRRLGRQALCRADGSRSR